MRKFIYRASAVGMVMVTAAACSVGVDAGVGGSGCDAISCQSALVGGLSAPGITLCDAAADSSYANVLGCACLAGGGSGLCEPECGDNLCQDGGETSACGDCLNANCAPEHDTCANN